MAEELFERRTAFNAGEISPWLDPRIDQDKYHLGCRKMRNMKPTVYGGAFRRPGTEYLAEAYSNEEKCRLVTFSVEVGTSYVLELGDYAMRIWTTGDTPALVLDGGSAVYTQDTPWSGDDVNALQFSQLNDILFVTHPDYHPHCIVRYGAADWRVVKYNPDWPALLPENDTETTLAVVAYDATGAAWDNTVTYEGGDKVTRGGLTFTSRHDGNLNHEPRVHKHWKRWWKIYNPTGTYSIGRRVKVQASKATFEAGHKGTKWVLTWKREDVKRTMNIPSHANGYTGGALFVLGEWTAALRADNDGTGDWDVEVTVERSKDNIDWETRASLSGSRASVQQLTTGNETEPCFLRIKLVSKSGTIPTRYKVELEASNPSQHGIIRMTKYNSATEMVGVIEFPCPKGDATEFWNEPAWSSVRGFPRAITIHENRLWFGGTKTQPTTFWATALDRFEDFRLGSDADRAKEFQVQSDEANAIEWMCSHEVLVIGTRGAEWFYGQRIGEDLPKIRRNTNYGSAAVQARVVNESLVFIQRSKRKLREFASDQGGGFACPDLTLLAEHFGDAKFIQLAVQRNPETVVWVLTDQGDLCGLVYERAQNVAGWFRYSTAGAFESMAIVEGTGEEDQLWVAVKRTIGGTTKRFVERFQPDLIRTIKEGDQTGLIYSDAAAVYDGTPATTITGLDHLEGMSVTILADGAPHPARTVTDGEITLQWAASKVICGLAYTSLVEPTYLETNDPGSITKAFKKRITRAAMEFWQSLGAEISADGGTTYHPIEFRTVADYMDEVPPLFSGIKEEMVSASSARQASVILRQTQPLPMNLLSLVIRFTMGTA